jgi:hypothetical protein
MREENRRSRARADCPPSTLEKNHGCLTYFPAANSEKEGNDIRLLLLLKLFDVLEGTHLGCLSRKTVEVSEKERQTKELKACRKEESSESAEEEGTSHTGFVEVLVVSRMSKIFKRKEPPNTNFPWKIVACGLSDPLALAPSSADSARALIETWSER